MRAASGSSGLPAGRRSTRPAGSRAGRTPGVAEHARHVRAGQRVPPPQVGDHADRAAGSARRGHRLHQRAASRLHHHLVGEPGPAAGRPRGGGEVRRGDADADLAYAGVVPGPRAERTALGGGQPGRYGGRRGRPAGHQTGQLRQRGEPAERDRFRLALAGAGQQQRRLQLGDAGQPAALRHRVLPSATGVAHQVDVTHARAGDPLGRLTEVADRRRDQVGTGRQRVEQRRRDRHRPFPRGGQRGEHPVGVAQQVAPVAPEQVQAAVRVPCQQPLVAERPAAGGLPPDQQHRPGLAAPALVPHPWSRASTRRGRAGSARAASPARRRCPAADRAAPPRWRGGRPAPSSAAPPR